MIKKWRSRRLFGYAFNLPCEWLSEYLSSKFSDYIILLYDTELHRKTAGLNWTGHEMVRNEINFLSITQRRISRR